MIDLSTFLSLADINLGALADKPTTLTPGQKEAANSLWTSPDGLIDIGLWECTPGQFTADRSSAAEFCHFLSGQIVMTHQNGTKQKLGPGDALLLPLGWKGTWEILEHTKKIYVFMRSGSEQEQ